MKTIRFLISLLILSLPIAAQVPSGAEGKTGGKSPADALQSGGRTKASALQPIYVGTTGGLVLGDPDNANTSSVTVNRALSTAVNWPIFFHTVEGAVLNSQVWLTSTSTFTIAQASGLITLNSGASVSTSKYAILKSIKNIPLYGNFPTEVHAQFTSNVAPEANATMELGLGNGATTAAPADFIGIRWSGTSMLAVVANNSTEITASIAAPSITTVHTLRLLIRQAGVTFFVDGAQVADIPNAAGNTFPTSVGRLPIFARSVSASSAPATAPELSVGNVYALSKDFNTGKNWMTTLAAHGRGLYQNPLTTFAATTNHTDSTSPSSLSLSNTVPGMTTMGGRYAFASISSAATDYVLDAFQCPTGFQMFVTRVRISAMVTGAANATTATTLDWGLGINSSAASLQTADSGNTTWADRRIPIGMQGFVAAAAIGVPANDIDVSFDPPLVVDSARFFKVILQIPLMTATSSEVIRGDILINGYFE
jgi:hypothetical protein